MKLFVATTVFALTSWLGFAQNNYNITDVVGTSGSPSGYFYYCDSTIDIDFFAGQVNSNGADINAEIIGTNFEPTTFEVQVYWGDGSLSVHSGTVTNQGQAIQFSPSIVHTYPSGGNYSVAYIMTNIDNQTVAGDTTSISVGNNCSFDFYSLVSVDCDSNGVIENTINSGIDIILTNNNSGQSYNGTLNNSLISYSGVPIGTYTYEIDPQWLSTNGYYAVYSPQNVFVDSLNSPQTTQILLHCLDSTSVSQQNCLAGQVYCDVNQNGFYDNGETPLVNAPVTIYPYNSSSFTVYTDQNGFFQSTYNDPNSGGQQYTVVQINNNWLIQNGYGNGYYLDTIFNTICGSNDTLNFPVQCPSNIDTACISGFVFCDDNGNMTMDNNENPIMNAPVNIQTGLLNVTVYTDSFGYFNYCGTELYVNQTLMASVDTSWLINNGYSIANNYQPFIATNNPSLNNYNGFGINCGGGNSCTDFWVTVTPWIGYFQNQNNYFHINWGSNGPGIVGDYELSLTFPNNVTPNTGSFNNQNYVINGNTITWTITQNSAMFSNTDLISFFTSSGIASGTGHYFIASITPINGGVDCNYSNNINTLLQIVGNSYDPNDKLVDHPEVIDPNTVDTLTYTVRFQNTGTAPAQDVYILDTISSNLEYESLEILSTSHSMQLLELGNNTVRFDFPDIWLPDSNANEPLSHGYVTYRIVEKASNTLGDEIMNTAHIYFDWNPAIITNTTYNINTESLSATKFSQNELVMYPNPADESTTVLSEEIIRSIIVYDVQGKVIVESQPMEHQTVISLDAINSGVYIIQIQNETSTTTRKLIKK